MRYRAFRNTISGAPIDEASSGIDEVYSVQEKHCRQNDCLGLWRGRFHRLSLCSISQFSQIEIGRWTRAVYRRTKGMREPTPSASREKVNARVGESLDIFSRDWPNKLLTEKRQSSLDFTISAGVCMRDDAQTKLNICQDFENADGTEKVASELVDELRAV